MVDSTEQKPAEVPKEEAQASTDASPVTTEKTEEDLAKEKAAAEKKAQKEANKAKAKAEKEAKKAARLAAKQKELEEKNKFVKDPNDPCADKFGDLPINMSQCDPEERFTKVYTEVRHIGTEHNDKVIRIRGRMHNSRVTNKNAFCVIREGYATVQTVMFVGETISKGMVKYTGSIPKESIVEIVAKAVTPSQPIKGCTQQMELQVEEIWCVNKSTPMLPIQLEDLSRQVLDQAAEDGGAAEESKEKGDKMPVVKQDMRLNNRIIDLRVPTNQAIMRIQSGVGQIYREFLYSRDFVEIHSPKIIGGTSEGGANVFRLKYFERDACLAQSPQLYKQMALCGDLQRVFEIGPVFRAENSNTNRHLCEFTGLDLEMEFKNHYFEVLDLIGELMVYLFKNLKERYARELSVVN